MILVLTEVDFPSLIISGRSWTVGKRTVPDPGFHLIEKQGFLAEIASVILSLRTHGHSFGALELQADFLPNGAKVVDELIHHLLVVVGRGSHSQLLLAPGNGWVVDGLDIVAETLDKVVRHLGTCLRVTNLEIRREEISSNSLGLINLEIVSST